MASYNGRFEYTMTFQSATHSVQPIAGYMARSGYNGIGHLLVISWTYMDFGYLWISIISLICWYYPGYNDIGNFLDK